MPLLLIWYLVPNLLLRQNLSPTEIEALRKFMTQPESSATTSSSLAYSCNLATFLSTSHSSIDPPWVIDSGAFDHMIPFITKT